MVRTRCRALGPYLKEFRMGGEYDQQIREVAMYSLPKEFDEKRFIGCTLYEIGFNANQIRLSFEPNLVVVVEGEACERATKASCS